MTHPIHFELVSPEARLFADEVTMVVIPGTEGDFGVLSGHMPLVANVKSGVVEIFRNDMKNISERYFIAGGVADVTGTQCTLLAEQAVNVNDIDRTDIERKIAEAEEDIKIVENDSEKDSLHKKLATYRAMLHSVR